MSGSPSDAIRESILDAIAALMPTECAGCGLADRSLCVSCRSTLGAEPRRRMLPVGVPVFVALEYEGITRRVLIAFKEQHRTDLARALAQPMRRALDAARGASVAGDVLVIPVPTSRAAYRGRGFDPVALILARAGVRTTRALAHTRSTQRQKSLSMVERESNLRGSMRLRLPVDGRHVILIDDVVTTGATLSEAVRVLISAGAIVEGCATVAFTARKSAARHAPGEVKSDIDGQEGYGEEKARTKPPGNRAAR